MKKELTIKNKSNSVLNYYLFIMKITLRKRSFLVLSVLLLFVFAGFFYLVPIVTKTDPLMVWANPTIGVAQTFVIFISSILCAYIAINIFRQSIEDGTELLIVSKPISRGKILITKFLAFFSQTSLLNVLSVILSSFVFLIPDFIDSQLGPMIAGIAVGNFFVFTVFGLISILLSSRFTTVFCVLISFLISFLMSLYSILALSLGRSPTLDLVKQGYWMKSRVYTNPINQKNYELINFNMDDNIFYSSKEVQSHFETDTSFQDYYAELQKIDTTAETEIFDFGDQLASFYTSPFLNNYKTLQASGTFGISFKHSYNLMDKPVTLSQNEQKNTIPILYSGVSSDNGTTIPSDVILATTSSPNTIMLTGKSNNIAPIGYVEIQTKVTKKTELDYWTFYNINYDKTFIEIAKELFGSGKTYDISIVNSNIDGINENKSEAINSFFNEVGLLFWKDQKDLGISDDYSFNQRFLQFESYLLSNYFVAMQYDFANETTFWPGSVEDLDDYWTTLLNDHQDLNNFLRNVNILYNRIFGVQLLYAYDYDEYLKSNPSVIADVPNRVSNLYHTSLDSIRIKFTNPLDTVKDGYALGDTFPSPDADTSMFLFEIDEKFNTSYYMIWWSLFILIVSGAAYTIFYKKDFK